MKKSRPERPRDEVARLVSELTRPVTVFAVATICGLSKATVLCDVYRGAFPLEYVIRVRRDFRIHPSGIIPYFDQFANDA
ncbi:MAG: hypothetical protein GC208_10500 [Alphaproteobacteria bacterium]|nr:hypothetical protein [Alphaproteobacteria bacterium]